jgi:hypothetical protein
MVRIHINRHVIAANRKTGAENPPISVVKKGKTQRAHVVDLIGPARIIYAPRTPLKCGATAWIEATDAVIIEHSL